MDTTPTGISGLTARDIRGPSPLIAIENESRRRG